MSRRATVLGATVLGATVLGATVLAAVVLGATALAAVVLTLSAAPAKAQVATGGAPAAARTVVTFTWGGGLADQMGALPIFEQDRMHATFYVPSGYVCETATDPGCAHSPYLTLPDIRQIAAAGNEIGGLSVGHLPLTGFPAAEAQREICDDRVNLTRWGFRVTDFAYPFAEASRTLETLAQRCGYNSGLGTGQLRGAGLCPHCAWAETIPPQNPYLLRAPIEVSSVGTNWTAATFEQIVTGAQNHGGGWIIFTVHDVCAQACALGVTRAELSNVLAWLSRQARHGVSVQTVRQVVGAQSGQPYRVRARHGSGRLEWPTPASPWSLRAASRPVSRRPGMARIRRPSGTSAGAGPARTGAELVSVTGRTSGTAQLLPALDLGECAPTVSPGRSYTLGAWYKSSQPVTFNVYSRTSVGTWKFWVSSPPMAAAPGWTQVKWTPPAVPSGVTAISFGVALRSDGTVTTSRYSLVPVRYSSTRLIALSVGVAALVVVPVATRSLRRRGRPDPAPAEPLSRRKLLFRRSARLRAPAW